MASKKSSLFSVFSRRNSDWGFIFVLFFFLLVIFLPAVYILGSFGSPKLLFSPNITNALFLSLAVGLIVTIFNLLLGVPLAWMIVRSKNPFLKWLDNLIDLSLVMPTAALGFSVYFYYGSTDGLLGLLGFNGGLIDKGPLLIILLHIVFTFPYMVRSVTAAILQLDEAYEEASFSLGASPFTFFRTVALPLCQQGVVNGSILSFTRSLSETGATMMVAGAFATAPVLVVSLKDGGNFPAAAGLSIALILIALLILILAQAKFGRKRFNFPVVHSSFEKKISGLYRERNIFLTAIYFLLVFIPTVYLVLYYFLHFEWVDCQMLMGSLVLSLGIAGVVTIVNAFFALPLSYLISRNRLGVGGLVESLSEVILLVPTSALGLSLAFFWGKFLDAEIMILALAHLCFTFPFFVKPLVTAFNNISYDQEEAAHTLGAGSVEIFKNILLPQIKPALVTGAIMVFMRSLSETGATLAVSKDLKTVSVLIVDLFKQNRLSEAAIACVVLFAFSLVFLFLLKKFQNGNAGALSHK